MKVILFIWMAGLILTVLLFIPWVRERKVNLFFACAVIIDALKDVGCQMWLDVSSIWKRRKKVKLDITEEYYHK